MSYRKIRLISSHFIVAAIDLHPRAAGDFLDSLSPAERQAFISVASKRTFRLQGQDHSQVSAPEYVLVVLGGWTQITVQEKLSGV